MAAPGAISTRRRALATALAFGVFGAIGIPAATTLILTAGQAISGETDVARAIGDAIGWILVLVVGWGPIAFMPSLAFGVGWVLVCRLVFAERVTEDASTV